MVKELIKPEESVLVILDSNRTKSHVFNELNAYYSLVTPGSHIVATDGIMQELYDVPRGKPEWDKENPSESALEFVKTHPEFTIFELEIE